MPYTTHGVRVLIWLLILRTFVEAIIMTINKLNSLVFFCFFFHIVFEFITAHCHQVYKQNNDFV